MFSFNGLINISEVNSTSPVVFDENGSYLTNPLLTKSILNFLGTGKYGGATIEIGSNALAEQQGETLFSEPSHVLHAAVSALRDPLSSEHKTEIIIASLAVWGMIEDLSDNARLNLTSLLEAMASTVDQSCLV